MKQIDEILKERPAFHSGETEIGRTFQSSESFLNKEKAEQIARQTSVCYGIGSDLAHFLADTVESSSQTLETGAGISTLIFALRGAAHIAITPNQTEVEAIQSYATIKEIDLSHVEFVIQPSELYLPTCGYPAQSLDLVLIDGKHAFPWPILDWFFTAEQLRRGGLLILDDAELRSVGVLVEFLIKDPRWSLEKSFGSKTLAFRKESDPVHDVAWHMQPYNFGNGSSQANQTSLWRRFVSKLIKR